MSKRKIAPDVGPIEPETFLGAVRRLEDADLRTEDGKLLVKAARESAKALGIDMAAYKFVQKLKRLGPDAAEKRLRHAVIYCGWLNIPIGNQLDLFQTSDVPKPNIHDVEQHSAWEAQLAGHKLGMAGAAITDIDERYQAGTENHVAAIKGWHGGQAVLAEGLIEPSGDAGQPPPAGDDEPLFKDRQGAGFAAGRRGDSADSCPHEEGSPFRHSWLVGHSQGTSQNKGGVSDSIALPLPA